MSFLGIATKKDLQEIWQLLDCETLHSEANREAIADWIKESVEKHHVEKHLHQNYGKWLKEQDRRRLARQTKKKEQ